MFGWVTKLIGNVVSKKIGLMEGTPMENKKPWYQSRNVWTGVVTVLVGAYESVSLSLAPQLGWNLPQIPPLVFTLLGALGIYTRVTATKSIG